MIWIIYLIFFKIKLTLHAFLQNYITFSKISLPFCAAMRTIFCTFCQYRFTYRTTLVHFFIPVIQCLSRQDSATDRAFFLIRVDNMSTSGTHPAFLHHIGAKPKWFQLYKFVSLCHLESSPFVNKRHPAYGTFFRYIHNFGTAWFTILWLFFIGCTTYTF